MLNKIKSIIKTRKQNNLYKEISKYYWDSIEPLVDGYNHHLVNEMLQEKFNINLSNEKVLNIIYNY